MFVRKPSKGSITQAMSAHRQPWRRENKKMEVAVEEEPKKVVKGKKKEKGGIPPLVMLPECKHEPIEEEK